VAHRVGADRLLVGSPAQTAFSFRKMSVKMSSRLLIIASLLALLSAPATAGVVLDPQIFVGNPGSSNPPGGTAVGGEGNLLTDPMGGFVVGVAGGSNQVLQNPLLVIVGAYDATAPITGAAINNTNCPGIISCPGAPTTGTTNPMPPPASFGPYGLTANGITVTGGDIYTALGLPEGSGGGPSVTVANINGILTQQQVPGAPPGTTFAPATSFFLTVFDVPVGLTGHQAESFSESLFPPGSFVIGFGCNARDPTLAPCSGGDVGASPLTNIGIIDTTTTGPPPPPPPPPPPVPEPSSLVILGGAVLALLWWARNPKPTRRAA
jgi:hypothetical protein